MNHPGNPPEKGPPTTALTKASERYSDATKLRATIQLIPYVGGSLDTLLAGKGAEIQRQRVENFLRELNLRLTKIEGLANMESEEAFFDFMLQVFDGVVRAKTTAKITRFASLVTNQVIERRPWEDTDTAVRLLSELSDIHIEVLIAVLAAPSYGAPFEDLKVTTLIEPQSGNEKAKAAPLAIQLPQYSEMALRMACSELVSKGLLHDEGIGRWGTKAMQYFITTDLAEWFLGWIRDKAS